MESDEYELSESEDDYSKDDKLLLDYARNSMKKKDISSDEEVFGFYQSDSDEGEDGEEDDDDEGEDKGSDIDMGSDLEDEEKLPDDRAWGKKKKSFYSTDFVDQDYDGIYQGEEAEIAELEEQEAKNIQKRLVEQLNEADFSITEVVNLAEATEAVAKQEVIQTDISKLSKRQKLDIVKKESPEFFVLVQDFKEKLEEAQTIMPVVNYFKSRVKQSFPALDFLQTKLTIIFNYCTNISFYLYLKAKRIPIKNHPILKSLFKYRKLLEQMEDVDVKVIKPQLNDIVDKIKSGQEIPLDESITTKKPVLKLLSDKQKLREITKQSNGRLSEMEEEEEDDEEEDGDGDVGEDGGDMDQVKDEAEMNQTEKRAITYEMAKNKGLTPRRKKELRNPRVKNRRKYEKAKVRRKGQVRQPRKEIPVYGGEISGIKTTITKSIKFK